MKIESSAAKPANSTSSAEDRRAAEWHASAALQAEYPTAESYVATMKRQAQRPAAITSRTSADGTPEAWASEWRRSTELQAEYPTEGAYIAIMKRRAAAT